jgi:hypothetical protein
MPSVPLETTLKWVRTSTPPAFSAGARLPAGQSRPIVVLADQFHADVDASDAMSAATYEICFIAAPSSPGIRYHAAA